jgi:hypothetical protein
MDLLTDLRARLLTIAERSQHVRSACTNEESTKLFLILPVIRALEYDCSDPSEMQAEYAADFRGDTNNRVDFAILQDGLPVVAVECKKAGTNLSSSRGQLRSYFSALPTVKLGILTDGVCFEFFVDCDNPNVMDDEPFLTLDMDVVAQGDIQGDVLETLSALSRSRFDPESISSMAEMRLVARRLRTALLDEVRDPSEEFCRMMLQRVGLKNLRKTSIQQRYAALIRSAYHEALIRPVAEHLQTSARSVTASDEEPFTTRQIMTTDRELSVFRYVCRRLAFLASDERQFSAIEHVKYRDYVGKFAVFYENVRKGRLFDFVEGSNGFDKFVFPDPIGEIITNSIVDIDEPLRTIFSARVRELGSVHAPDRIFERA